MFNSGDRVFLPGASGEPSAMAAALTSTPDLHILTTFVPGVNRLPKGWAAGTTVTGPFAFPGTGYRHLPMSYGALARHVAGAAALDAVVVQVSAPDARGRCSLGPAVEFSGIALSSAARRIAVANLQTPWFNGAPSLPLADFDVVIEADAPLATYHLGPPDEAADLIACHIANHIGDGAALQIGLGKTPGALMRRLADRRGLRLHSGMLSDDVRALARAGALDPRWPHVTTVFLGSADLYAWAADQDLIRVAGCEVTHDPRVLAAIEGLVAVNSALEVDLLGQCNLEAAAGRQISGAGGAPDFARAARLGEGGLSIIALPSTFAEGRGSRITGRLGSDSLVSLSRVDVDLVVTEHGVADLRGQSAHGRAEALIAVAAPAARGALRDQWRDMSRQLGL